MEEFQEAEVLWPDHDHRRDDHGHGHHRQQQQNMPAEQPHFDAARGGEVRRRAGTSAPVGIPPRTTVPAQWAQGYDDEGDGAAFVPPHEVAARRRCSEEKAASSVCVGHGRTLKGRDLQCVRTAVLRMTGFLET